MSASVCAPVTNMADGKDIRLTDLTATLYRDLRRVASRHLSAERPNHTLQPTALVHEAYLKLAKERTPQFADEVHLFAVASRVMRQVLVDYARSRGRQKRQGQATPIDLKTTIEFQGQNGADPDRTAVRTFLANSDKHGDRNRPRGGDLPISREVNARRTSGRCRAGLAWRRR